MLQFIEGFERFPIGTSADRIGERYAITGNLNNSSFIQGRNGGYAFLFEGGQITKALPSSTSYIIGFALKNVSATTTTVTIVSCTQGGLTFNATTSSLSIYNNVTSTIIALPTLITGTWYYLELFANSGNLSLNINGLPTATLTGGGSGALSSFSFGGSGVAGQSVAFDDVYVLDLTGTNNNGFLGDVIVEGLRPVYPGSYSQWTPANANISNFESVANSSNGAFVYTNTIGTLDSYIMQNSELVQRGPIYGVNMGIEARNTDLTMHAISAFVKTGTTTNIGLTKDISSTNATWFDFLMETNPNTSSQWQSPELASSEFGVVLQPPI
jgi:hypothetical protein